MRGMSNERHEDENKIDHWFYDPYCDHGPEYYYR